MFKNLNHLKLIIGILHRNSILVLAAALLFIASNSNAQFIDNFNGSSIITDPTGINGWNFFTGDGFATMTFSENGKGYASITIDATKDKRGIWWALIKRCVSGKMNTSLLNKSGYGLRIESRIRVSDAPKRVNLSLNTQRTTDFHKNLMEFDIPDTINWHTISLTLKNFDAVPGDTVYGQLALMDWGLKKYRVDLDYFKVDIVNIDSAGPDKGAQVPYHPPIPPVSKFAYHISANQEGMIDSKYPELNFKNWCTYDNAGKIKILTVSGTQFIIIRWDLSEFAGMKAAGHGLLEIHSYSLQHSLDYTKDFGMIRLTEITGGDPKWCEDSVTYNNFCKGKSLDGLLNSQMIIDINVNEKRGGKNMITISNPVLQRMIDGKTLGIAILPLGAVNASFYADKNVTRNYRAKLHMNIVKDSSNNLFSE